METLRTFYPNLNDLLATPPEDIAPTLLKFARAAVQNGMFLPDEVNRIATGAANVNPALNAPGGYDFHQIKRIEPLLTQAWNWLEQNGLIVKVSGMNGRNGWMVFTQKGENISDTQDFARLKEAAKFPKELIYPAIADKVWGALMRNDLDLAVFISFKAVEEAVREAGGFSVGDYGVQLMRDAFHRTSGPLTDLSKVDSERDALAHLFAGAIGSYKNPHSHRTVNLTDTREAQEQVMLASHLLRIVDSRRRS